MPSFDVGAELNWQEVDNAVNQTEKEIVQRFDFKGIKTEIKVDQKAKTITLWCGSATKLDDLNDVMQKRLIKRGVSLLCLDYQPIESAMGNSGRQLIKVKAGISKEDGKKVIAAIKEQKFKVQSQIQEDQVRVSGKNRDDLQEVIAFLRGKAVDFKIPFSFSNFRE